MNDKGSIAFTPSLLPSLAGSPRLLGNTIKRRRTRTIGMRGLLTFLWREDEELVE